MESYIRPGFVILTIYFRLPNWMWDKVALRYINTSVLNMFIASLWLPVNKLPTNSNSKT